MQRLRKKPKNFLFSCFFSSPQSSALVSHKCNWQVARNVTSTTVVCRLCFYFTSHCCVSSTSIHNGRGTQTVGFEDTHVRTHTHKILLRVGQKIQKHTQSHRARKKKAVNYSLKMLSFCLDHNHPTNEKVYVAIPFAQAVWRVVSCCL